MLKMFQIVRDEPADSDNTIFTARRRLSAEISAFLDLGCDVIVADLIKNCQSLMQSLWETLKFRCGLDRASFIPQTS